MNDANDTTPAANSEEVFSWGRYPRQSHSAVHEPYWPDQIAKVVDSAAPGSLLPRGLGRSYGDSCLNASRELLDLTRLDRIQSFGAATGRIQLEAGVSLADILTLAVPRGWFLPVTPGTKFVTVGGAIANDVHGKNHHRAGCFGNHVLSFTLYRSDRGAILCSPTENVDLYRATIGGLGLTGIILSVDMQLTKIQSAFIDVDNVPFHSLDEFLAISAATDSQFEYTVAWVDCFGGKNTRGIYLRGNHSSTGDLKPHKDSGLRVPLALPEWVLNSASIKAFNNTYYTLNSIKSGKGHVHYDPFFYPLDAVLDWNLIYGDRGFLQYQFVLPSDQAAALQQILTAIAEARQGSFLAVLKKFGSVDSPGLLSFPREGLTLAMDFAFRGDRTLALLEHLDQIVLGCGGRLYPAKDARMSPEAFRASYPQWNDFSRFIDPKLSSSFIRRVIAG